MVGGMGTALWSKVLKDGVLMANREWDKLNSKL